MSVVEFSAIYRADIVQRNVQIFAVTYLRFSCVSAFSHDFLPNCSHRAAIDDELQPDDRADTTRVTITTALLPSSVCLRSIGAHVQLSYPSIVDDNVVIVVIARLSLRNSLSSASLLQGRLIRDEKITGETNLGIYDSFSCWTLFVSPA